MLPSGQLAPVGYHEHSNDHRPEWWLSAPRTEVLRLPVSVVWCRVALESGAYTPTQQVAAEYQGSREDHPQHCSTAPFHLARLVSDKALRAAMSWRWLVSG